MIELYAIATHPGPALPERPPVRAVPCGELAGLCAPAGDEGETTPEELWRHEEVIEVLMEGRDLLPVRYGTRLRDEAAVASAIAERRDELGAALERVRGAVELSVRAVPGDAPDAHVAPRTGAGYLRARARASEFREHAMSALHEPLSQLSRACVTRSPREPSEILRGAYLVDRAAVERFTALVARLDEADPGLALVCTGPWPPYSFAER